VTAPEPPPVTIVDPNAPAGTADLLDSGRDPWRPTRATLLTGAVAVLVLGIVGAGLAQLRHVQAQHAAARHERDLDRAAVAAVALTVGVVEPESVLDGPGPPPLQVTVTNVGTDTIHLTGLTLEDVAVPVDIGGDLPGGVANGFDLPVRIACSPRAGRDISRTVTVSLTTDRGDPVTQEVPLSQEGNEVLNESDRRRCGTLRPAEALVTGISLARRSGGWVLADLTVTNQSVLPLTLSELTFPDGLELQVTGLPAVLPPQRAVDEPGTERTLHLRVRVQSCAAWDRALDPVLVSAVLDGQFERETTDVQVYVDGEGITNPGVLTLLRRECHPDQPVFPG
jgi:hypothetical protein